LVKHIKLERRWIWIALALNALAVLVGRFAPPGVSAGLWSDSWLMFGPLVTLPLAFAPKGKAWATPSLLTATAVTALLGQAALLLTYYGPITAKPVSYPTVIWLLAYLLGLLTVLWWPSEVRKGSQRLRYVLDGLAAMAAAFGFMWVFVLGPVSLRAGGQVVEETLQALYLLVDVVVVVCAVQILKRQGTDRYRSASVLGTVAVVILILFDLPDAFGVNRISNFVANVFVAGWPFALTLTNFSARELIRAGKPQPAEPEELVPTGTRRTIYFTLVPYLLLPAMTGLLIVVETTPSLERFELGVHLAVLMMTLCLVYRQVLSLGEHRRLVDTLRNAYTELEATNSEAHQANDDLHDVLARLAEKNEELADANKQLAQLVTVDGMTGLANHRAFQERLRVEIDAAARYRYPLTVLMGDVDHFKRYNDEYGHPAGDDVLRQIARAIHDSVDLRAYPARYGGEEFAIVLPYFDETEAMELANRILKLLSMELRARRPVTMSFGAASLSEKVSTPEGIVLEADRALYVAKSRGRNRVVIASDLTRRNLSLDTDGEGKAVYDPAQPMGLAAVLSAGLRNHPQALVLEPESQLVSGLLATLELKDLETRDHSERVLWYAMRLAQSVINHDPRRMSRESVRALAYGALLHDIGKIGVPEQILKHPGELDPEMRAVVREHPRLGSQIVQKFPSLEMALPVIRHHHERWDGSGYPAGLLGTDIPLVARIFALVDALEAMSSARPYKEALPIERIIERIEDGAGTAFDPELVAAFLAVPIEEWATIRAEESILAASVAALAGTAGA